MKKLLCILLVFALLFSVAACGGGGAGNDDDDTSPKTDKGDKGDKGGKEDEGGKEVTGTYYDTGTFKAFVPEGWKEFPQHDVFSDDPNEMNPDVLSICKGGSDDWDLFSKPNIRINYAGKSTKLFAPDESWYEDVEQIAEFKTGDHVWTGFKGTSYGTKYIILFEDKGEIQYQASLMYETDAGKISLDDADVLKILSSIESTNADDIAAQAEHDGAAQPADEPSTEPAEPTDQPSEPVDVPATPAADYSWWENEWYGWWCITNATGRYEKFNNYAWDAYAVIYVYSDDTGLLMLWDTETSKNSGLMNSWVTFEPGVGPHGVMAADTGSFFDGGSWVPGWNGNAMSFGSDAWSADPAVSTVSHFDNMIEITGTYADPEVSDDSFVYHIYLRPWGTRWDDVKSGDTSGCLYSDMMPMQYDDWYIPLLELGVDSLPESYNAGKELLQ